MRRQLIYALVFILSLSIVILLWPINDSDCNSEAFLSSKTKKFQVQATKVVVQPWRGEHHVYGIFMVPNEYKQTPLFVLTVKGFGSECSKPFGYSQNYDDISADPGTHLVRDYLRTRTALRLILQGLYAQLKDKQNWTLTYPQPKR
ncbi:hypothetical protein BV372_28630 [Nostoc sp. T09]|uniref:hypothetical protein n=1 Tax=Nostoc sp. T09 TaxID=1932621 RepID=UPI000A3BC063|nr:hypothetical protein [Nostoc sp. T09]OUL24783.1 hypothetical protein BV372_28630 [Nostoc sp. T09]